MKTKKLVGLTFLLILTLSVLGGCHKPPVTYTVTFNLNGGELVSGELVQTVEEGTAAVAPEAVMADMALRWDKDFHAVTQDMTVSACWTRVPMSTVDLAAYVQKRTVTVEVDCTDGSSPTGSGFFIDDQGTVLTNFHVTEGAEKIRVLIENGGICHVNYIISFDPRLDLSILQTNLIETPYLRFAEEDARTGEAVYAVGTALGILPGTFTQGMVSHDNRTLGSVDYLQMDTAISHGNSGGPLVNIYGDVVGINTSSYMDGQNLNLAIKPHEVDKLLADGYPRMSISEFRDWYEENTAISYYLLDSNGHFRPSLINTYQEVIGSECISSISYDSERDRYTYKDGYVEECYCYEYEYGIKEFGWYEQYLLENGFENDGIEEYSDGVSHYFYDHTRAITMELFVSNDKKSLFIYPSAY